MIRAYNEINVLSQFTTKNGRKTPKGVPEKLSRVSGDYTICLIFHEQRCDFKIYSSKYTFQLFELADFLHKECKINNFDILVEGEKLKATDFIRASAIINVIGGFDKYLSSSWNKIMHALNGNTEEIGRKYPIDKSHERKNTRNNNKTINMNKNRNKFNGKKIFKVKEQISKVGGEIGLIPRDDLLNKEKLDITEPVVVDEAPAKKDSKEDKPQVDCKVNFEPHVGDKYIYDYTIEGMEPKIFKQHSNYIKYFGFIPKVVFAKADPNGLYYNLTNVILSVIMLVFVLTYWFDNIIINNFMRIVMFKPFNSDNEVYTSLLYEGNGLRFYIMKIFYPIVIMLLRVFLIQYNVDIYCKFSYPYYIFTRLVVCYVLYNIRNKIYGKYNFITYRPHIVSYGPRFYRRSMELVEKVLTLSVDETYDLRIESEKNFKIVHDCNIYRYSEKLEEIYPIGYYYDDKFIAHQEVPFLISEDTHLCDLELVCQMFNPKNTSMTVSAEAIAERISNSANLGPFINKDRRQPLCEDVINNSARFALNVTMHHRHAYKGDILDQLFRKGDRLRPTLPPSLI